jgi:hypothetical protein
MLGLLMFSIVPNAIMISVIVMVLQLTATLQHRCSVCEKELGTDGKYLLCFTDRVYSFSFRETGILVSKKILMTVGLFLLFVSIVVLKAKVHPSIEWTPLTWPTLTQVCPTNAGTDCMREYLGKTVINWRGWVMRVEDRRKSPRRFYEYAVEVSVKMNPEENAGRHPDLYLTGSTATLYDMHEVLDQLERGDEIEFNATFEKGSALGRETVNRHLSLEGMRRTGRRDERVEAYLTKREEEEYMAKIGGKALRHQK